MTAALEVKEDAKDRSRRGQMAAKAAKREGIIQALGNAFCKWASPDEFGTTAFRGFSISPSSEGEGFRVTVKVWGQEGDALVSFTNATSLAEAICSIPDVVRSGRFMRDKFVSEGKKEKEHFEIYMPPEESRA